MNRRKDLRSALTANPALAAAQERLQTAGGKRYWRTLEELAGSEAFWELVRQEFPGTAPAWADSLSRRRFLAVMGASLALAGIGGCSVKPAPNPDIVPYVHSPEIIVPG